MSTHSAKSLFDTNIESAKDCLALYDGIVNLKPAGLNIDWVLRAAVVFAVSALDTYFHDKVKYRVGKFSLENLPPALAKFPIPISELTSWEKAGRKGNTLRNWVVDYLSVRPLQSYDAIVDALKLAGIQSFWDTIEPNKTDKAQLLKDFNALIKRRNQISHEGDRETSRRSGKILRPVTRDEVVGYIKFVEDFVSRAETAFPG
jgi:restriction system protein